MSTDPGISVDDSAAIEAWIQSLPDKDETQLSRDQVILLNAIHHSLVHLQRSQIKLIAAIEEIAELQAEEAPVRVNDLDMPFTSMVLLILKWFLALIPAGLILLLALAIVFFVLRLLGWLPPISGF